MLGARAGSVKFLSGLALSFVPKPPEVWKAFNPRVWSTDHGIGSNQLEHAAELLDPS